MNDRIPGDQSSNTYQVKYTLILVIDGWIPDGSSSLHLLNLDVSSRGDCSQSNNGINSLDHSPIEKLKGSRDG
ncbi:MAG: hypothetical protein A2Z14_06480 [Chloroflexi bacterium RBG_16_48_8]|nr:MAG: hypothetical protein A2Z14_06480 [Chloroflexi bacterium RBG_16_48_8]